MIEPFSIVAPTASADGYGASAEALVLAAVRQYGADVRFVEHDWQDSRFTDPALFDLRAHEGLISQRETVVVYFLPYALQRYRSRVTLSMTMWETDRLPERWAVLLEHLADGVIVPSEHCREVFAGALSVPVVAVPFGTDTGLYEYVDRYPGDETIFLMAGLLHYRKGLDIALRAFREEFGPQENASLWLKTRQHFLDAGDEFSTLSDPRVRVIRDDYSRDRMANLYQSVDCLLAPSRGEGAGLTPRDAMATGCPVVATDWGGLAELADERYAWPIPVERLEAAPPENTSYGLGVTGGGDIGNFALPSVAAMRAAMREIHEDREAAYERGRAGAAWVRERWSWEVCAERWLIAVQQLADDARSREATAA